MGSRLHITPRSEISFIEYGIATSLFGNLLVAQSPKGIVHLSFFQSSVSEAIQSLKSEHPQAEATRNDAVAKTLIPQIFQPQPRLALHLWGTEFQIKVWKALLTIPHGKTSTYSQIADLIGHPESARAVGNAIGSNRIAYLIPCHRITRRDGSLGGYRWGKDCKTKLLEWENA